MIDQAVLFEQLRAHGLGQWIQQLQTQLPTRFSVEYHGDYPRWQEILQQLPKIEASCIVLDCASVQIGSPADLDAGVQTCLELTLQQLHPWRKGPFNVFGIHIDTEWRSDWKWDRLHEHIQPLTGRRVLDVGCGNGYHCWRMRGAGAALVIGIDPTLLFNMQFQALQHFCNEPAVSVLPLGIDDIPPNMHAFDTVFSMGVLYHRRSPLDHLLELRGCLCAGGELVLETLVIEGGPWQVLLPEDRYAQMRNVWYIPSSEALIAWLRRCGYRNIRLVDITQTSTEEQRSTAWMRFQSLKDFLDPSDPDLTIEGLPAPRRALIVAESP